ncbi:MAG: RluA family pseudouridine synthase [Alphaproteobacteria bacterium]
MSAFRTITVARADAGFRLDRWFRARFPAVGFGEFQKLLRTGQVRVDGKRAKANVRLTEGQEVRVPPRVQSGESSVPATEHASRPKPPVVRASDVEDLRRRVLYRDDDMIVLDKPAGLAVQGGSGTHRHLDAMLDALRFGADEKPRLVHRLDRDTSGVLVLARHRAAAQALTQAFRARTTRKIYLAVTVGVPRPRRGRIDLALGKAGGRGREKMVGDADDARSAVTLYAVMDAAAQRAALVTLMPRTGRTHQLRAHMAAIGTPILGDGKYGGRESFIAGFGLQKRLHLHASRLAIPKPSGGVLAIAAPLPDHMAATVAAFGFDASGDIDPFPED